MSKGKYLGHIRIPLQRVHIELTNVCDFNCLFCPKAEMKRPYGYMETALAKRLISEIGDKGIAEKVTFHVMGEPTLHRDFFEILDHACKEGVNVGLTTNGSRLSGEVGQKLLDYDLHQIDISLQTPDERSFTLRKAGALQFDKYLKGIFDFFGSYHSLHEKTIFKFRFLNTRFSNKPMEERLGPIRVISSTDELRETFRYWAGRIYDMLRIDNEKRESALKRIDKLVSYKWNVVEVWPNVFFETYVLSDWGHAFGENGVREAWAGCCFGMQDHFAVLYNGDVVLCCIDYDGNTKVGNVRESSLEEILSSTQVGEIVSGFRKMKLVHPYCRKCLGSKSLLSWIFKPVVSAAGIKVLKPFFYRHTKLYS
ncbi:MAG TPA: radical SAM/SPASM domain-containing protein [Dissulfurispiraceae bacterium]|nr:radical SAM/SPASM domain-containing protein [Dissulfurispiraceae bacterium]